MDWNAAHVGFVVASYGISAVLLVGMIAYVFSRDFKHRKDLAKFEKTKS
jgi:heme exporter protein CcmD